jgi:hypothetical protein
LQLPILIHKLINTKKTTLKTVFILKKLKAKKAKVLHAKPLHIGLNINLESRKGENKWNLRLGLTDYIIHDEYIGPQFTQHFSENSIQTNWQITSNIHYMISGTRNFVGLGSNKEINNNDFDMTIRPQMRVEITDNLLIGIVTRIPVKIENQRFSSSLRLIYESSSH